MQSHMVGLYLGATASNCHLSVISLQARDMCVKEALEDSSPQLTNEPQLQIFLV